MAAMANFQTMQFGPSHQTAAWTQCGKVCTRSKNVEMHMRTRTGSSTPAHTGGAANTQARSFAVRRNRRALGGAVEVHSVDMDAVNQLVALEDTVVANHGSVSAKTPRLQVSNYS